MTASVTAAVVASVGVAAAGAVGVSSAAGAAANEEDRVGGFAVDAGVEGAGVEAFGF